MKTVKTLLDMGEEKNVMNTISRIEEQVIGKKKLYRNKGRIPDQISKGSEKGKEAILDQ